MTQESIRSLFAKEFGDALKPRLQTQTDHLQPDPDPIALNDNRRLKAAILDSFQNTPTNAERQAAETARKNKAALREQILDALDINLNGK